MPHKTFRQLGFALLALAALTAGWLFWRSTSAEVWGYDTLLFYLAAFAGPWLLLTYRKDGTVVEANKLSALAGLLLGLGFPGLLPVPLTIFVGFVPLFLLYRNLRARNATYRTAFHHGFSGFLLFNIIATYWVTNTGFWAGLFAMLANAVLMALPWLALYWTGRKSPKIVFLAFAACWVAFEHFHYNWELNWPWLTLGNALAQWPSVIQWYEVTGALGGSAWVLGVNYALFKTAFDPASPPEKKRSPLLLAAVVLLPVVGSLVRYATYNAPVGEVISVAAIQPNFEPHFEKFADRRQAAPLDTFIRLSQAALSEGPVDYLLFPETSFNQIRENAPLESNVTRTLQAALAGRGAEYLVTGVSSYYVFAEGEPVTRAVRYSGNTVYEGLNAALQIKLGGEDYQTYRKGVFVPGAESFPFRDFLPFMTPLVSSIGGSVAGLGTQEERTPFTSPKAKVAPVICYESVFGDYFRDYIREGAQAIFVVTNDGWWGNTAGHRQHLYYASLRAIETRRAVVRSANVGACAFIDQRGSIVSRTYYDRAGFLRGELRLNDAITPYVRFGDMVSRIAMLLAAMVLLSNLARSLRREKA